MHSNLRTFNWQNEYRSDYCDLVQDFYIPCLRHSILYSRAVGFFSSTSMASVAGGLLALIQSGGKMRLIASPSLSAEDAEAIALGLKQKEEIITQSL
ncbi:MAG: DNA phosphorothioation system restriction enzyme, partial [Pseudanabaena sp.]